MPRVLTVLALVVLAGLGPGRPAAAGELTLEDLARQMEAMQAEITDLKVKVRAQTDTIESQAALLDERDTFSMSAEGEVPSGGYPTTTVGGYVDSEFQNFGDTDSDFDQHRFIVNVASQVNDRISFYSEIEFEHGVDSGAGGGEVEIEQAWMDFELYPWLHFRTGALLVPFGRYNLLHDSDLNDLTARPLYATRVVPTTWTEAGAGFAGDFDMPNAWGVSYEAYVVNGLDDGISDQGTRGARPALRRDNNNNKALVGRVAVTPTPWATVGFSGYKGRWTSTNGTADPSFGFGDETVYGYGLDLFLQRGPWEFLGEYGMFDFNQANKLGPVGPNAVILDGEIGGGYAQLSYHFWPSFLDDSPLGEPFDSPTFTLVGRYDYAEVGLTGADDNRQGRWILGINYRPIEEMVFKLAYHWNDHDGAGRALESNGENGVFASVALGF